MKGRWIRRISILTLVMMCIGILPIGTSSVLAAEKNAAFSINAPKPVLNATSGKLNNGKIDWSVSADGRTLTITGTGSDATIPSNAFAASSGALGEASTKVTNLVLKGSITTVESYAFTGCPNISSISFNSGLRLIRVGAFSNCTGLKGRTVSIPSSVNHVQDGAFRSDTVIKCANSNMKKYGNNGWHYEDYLYVTVSIDYDKAYQLFDLINQRRSAAGAPALKMYGPLLTNATVRASELVVMNKHTRPNGDPCFTVGGNVFNEVAASGGTTAIAVLSKLWGNTSNKASLLSADYKSVGISCVNYAGVNYWIILLGTKNPSTNFASPGNKTSSQAIEFPYNTNTIRLNGSNWTHNFTISPILIKKGENVSASLNLGNVSFVKSKVKWASSNTSVATVDSNGVITAKNAGEVTITAASSLNTERARTKIKIYDISRIYGSNKYRTATAAADKVKNNYGLSKFSSIIIANGDDYADAFSASYLASKKKAPILLMKKGNTGVSLDYINANLKSGGTVFIMGTKKSVPTAVDKALKKKGFKVKRISGKDKYATNIAALKAGGITNKDIVICSGTSMEGALVASALGKPVMLVGKKLTSAQIKLLKKGKTSKKCYIIGNKSYVSAKVEKTMKKLGFKVERVSAGNMYDLSVAVANKFFNSPNSAVFCSGKGFADSLAAGPLALSYKKPILIIKSDHYSEAMQYVKANNIRTAIVLGGVSAITDKVAVALTTW